MNHSRSKRLPWLLWLAALGFLIALALFPVSSRITRHSGVALAFVVWFGLIVLAWRQWIARLTLVALTLLAAGFIALPSLGVPVVDELRADNIAALQRYEGVTYYWGGENSRGIDCSGLIRRGLIDALIERGARNGDAGLVRAAITLWWNDCTARALAEGHRRLTSRVLETPSLNALDHSLVVPGDLAVTANGVHILAYLGDHRWIHADPMAGKVITVSTPSKENAWFHGPMTIVRWNLLR